MLLKKQSLTILILKPLLWIEAIDIAQYFHSFLLSQLPHTVLSFSTEDDNLPIYRRSLFATGKGRRPDVPLLSHYTHRLLLQLLALRYEGSIGFEEVRCWHNAV